MTADMPDATQVAREAVAELCGALKPEVLAGKKDNDPPMLAARAAAQAMQAAMAGREVSVRALEWKHNGSRYFAYCPVTNTHYQACNATELAKQNEYRASRIRSAPEPAGAREGAEDDMAATRRAAWKDTALIREASRRTSAAREPAHGADEHRCPICAKPFKVDDLCATDISEGICHAACLEGAPVVDLETGEETGGKADTYRYGDDVTAESGG